MLFDDSTLKRPVVRFGSAGTYILQVVVSDGELSAVDMITITVYTGANQAPVVDVGSNLVATLSAGADLSATVTDDGLPDGTLSYNWYLLDGPTDVVYAYGPLTNTDVWVGFDMTGVYTLALYASDGELYGADSLEIDVRSVPAVQLTSPTNTQGFADSEFIHFSAVATDSDGIVSSVEFFVNDISVGAVTNEPFAISMTNALPEGLYSAYAVGTDDDGNEGQSSNVLFSVGDVAVEPVWAELVSPTNNCYRPN